MFVFEEGSIALEMKYSMDMKDLVETRVNSRFILRLKTYPLPYCVICNYVSSE